jgi:serine/threonine protein kinase
MIGTRLAHYDITSHLGTGGMGEVYQATDSKLGRSVAIKLLPEAFSRDIDRVARFEREAKLLASLNHPNIAAIYGLEQSGDTRFLVLELVEGDTLAGKLQRGAIPADEALKLALQIAQALEAAHDKGVIHRDIKPANIKVTPDGKVKVLDFGLAKAFAPDERNVSLSNSPTIGTPSMESMAATQMGVILGTASYMSPEQASGQAVDKRADIWSFGVVLFEMLTGRPMFRGKTVSHVLADVLRAEPDWNCLPANLHPRVRLLLERCLEKEARDRYHDIADARVDIERVLADPQGVLVQPAAHAASAPRTARFRSVLPWVAATVIIAGALGWFLRPVPKREPALVVRFPFTLPESTQFTMPNLSMIAISPDGTKVAYVANSQLYLRNLNESEGRPISGTNDGDLGPTMPVFSPDGQSLAYVHVVSLSCPCIVKRVPVSGGTPVKVFDAPAGLTTFEWGLAWPTPDTLVFASSGGILRIPANGGTPEALVKRGSGETFESPQILPGGKQVLFVRLPEEPGGAGVLRWDAAEIVIQSIGGNDRSVVWKGGSHARYLPTGHVVYAQGNTLFALAVDLPSRKVTGGPVPILEGVRRSSNGFSDAAQYAVSDSGTLVAIPGAGASQAAKGVLALLDRNGVTTALNARPAQYRSPRFSPDGKQLAVEIIGDDGTSSIWIYDVSGKSEIRRLTEAGKNSTRPVWTTDGKRVNFGSDRDGPWGIYEQSADGSTLAERLTTAKDKRKHYPESWSPDGKTLAFVELVSDSNWDLWTFSRDSGTSALLAGGDDSQFGGVFSPDGKWLVYTDSHGAFGIHAQPFPPTGVNRQITQDGEAWPVWTAGGQIFFRLRVDGGAPNQLRSLDVTSSDGFTFRNPRSLQLPSALIYQNYRGYDVTRNGEKFVIIIPEEKDKKASTPAAAPRIDVVLNWFEELKQRLP